MTFETITLDIEKLAVQQAIGREWFKHLELTKGEGADDFMRDTITLRMVRQIATVGGESVTVPEIRVPDGWWQSFKEANLGVLLRWFPTRYRILQREQTWKAVELLPNVDLPGDYRIGALKVMGERVLAQFGLAGGGPGDRP